VFLCLRKIIRTKQKALEPDMHNEFFRENRHMDALDIILKSDRVDYITRSKAKEILAKEK